VLAVLTKDYPMNSKADYIVPNDVRIGHVHLKVADLQRSLDFYCGLLGFKITTMYGTEAAFISAGGYHHHIGLNVWFSKDGPPAPRNTAGLFHYTQQGKTLQTFLIGSKRPIIH
jgi:catechol 2,3-dioxygenase